MTVDQTAAWINANSDYIYFGRRMNGNSPAAFVLMAERPDEFADGINLLFNDGSVEFRELRWATESLNFTNAQLPPPRPAAAPLSAAATTSTISSTSDQLLRNCVAITIILVSSFNPIRSQLIAIGALHFSGL
jgi:hypothetical protein